MPKLSQQTLEKRFPCPHCGKTFRTRQGLSGHIQYKHPSGAPAEDNDYINAVLYTNKFKLGAEVAGFDKEEISEMVKILAFWHLLKALVEDERTKLNDADFKTYLIVSLSQMKANQLLFNKLQKPLVESISALMKIQSNITETIIYNKLSQ